MKGPIMLAGALLALPILAAPAAMAKSHHHSADSSGTKTKSNGVKPPSAAYPAAPAKTTPAAGATKGDAPK